MFHPFSLFLSLLSLSTLISFISCAGPSPILVDPNNPLIPRIRDFKQCSEPISCEVERLYYCGNGASCYSRTCIDSYGDKFPDYTSVPSCVETYKVSLTAAIITEASPYQVMRSTADACEVSSQMVILNSQYSRKTAAEIVSTIAPDMTWIAQYYTAYDIQLGFFYEAVPDQPIYLVTGKFRDQLRSHQSSLLDETASTFSIDRIKGALVNTSNFQMIPATFAIQRCSDGTAVAVAGTEKCPPIDPALVPIANAAASKSTSTSTTTRLLTILLPIIGSIVLITLIIAAVVIVRRRQANKVMRQTVQHTESTAEVTMA